MDGLYACLLQQLINLTVINQRRKKSQKIDHISLFLLWLKEGV